MSEQAVLLRRPALPGGGIPDAVLGHGRVTGEVARVLVADHYPNAARLHVVHTEPDQVEWYKLDGMNDAAASAEELRLAATATPGAARRSAAGPVVAA